MPADCIARLDPLGCYNYLKSSMGGGLGGEEGERGGGRRAGRRGEAEPGAALA